MKNNIIKTALLSAIVAIGASSCKEEINIGGVESPGLNENSPALYVVNNNGSTGISNIEFRNTVSADFTLKSSIPVTTSTTYNVAYDAASLDDYNDAHGTGYIAVPMSMVTLSNNVTIQAGQTESNPLTVTVKSDGSLDPDQIYAVPVLISDKYTSVVMIVLLNDLTSLKDCDKGEGVKIFSVMEVNGTNVLNNLRYTLKSNGKYMIDAVVLFSGNINYDADAAKVYFYPNENVQYLLDHRQELLKPLQNRGIKVIMGVMCNHDRACLAGLNDNSAKEFAKELKNLCDAYELDGIFYDDEYCNHNPSLPGFTYRSPEAFSRLAYEVKKLQPERWNVAYGYSNTGSAVTIDGALPETFIDYVLPDYQYGMGADFGQSWSDRYEGLPLSRTGAYSIECNYLDYSYRYRTEEQLTTMRENGYGAMMVFAMNPFIATAEKQDEEFALMAKCFYDDEVVIDPTIYAKTW